MKSCTTVGVLLPTWEVITALTTFSLSSSSTHLIFPFVCSTFLNVTVTRVSDENPLALTWSRLTRLAMTRSVFFVFFEFAPSPWSKYKKIILLYLEKFPKYFNNCFDAHGRGTRLCCMLEWICCYSNSNFGGATSAPKWATRAMWVEKGLQQCCQRPTRVVQ